MKVIIPKGALPLNIKNVQEVYPGIVKAKTGLYYKVEDLIILENDQEVTIPIPEDLFQMVKVEGNDNVNSFYMGRYPVTQKEWKYVIGDSPSEFKGDNHPVDSVSWDDTQEFLEKLNEITGETYRLPTEAEWEYAARGGNQSKGYKFAGGNALKEVAWYDENSNNSTQPVGQLKPNELGIHDMSGNVWEWCEDWYDVEKKYKILRGGSWFNYDSYCEFSSRYYYYPHVRYNYFGFRLVKEI